jgi:hypothetical protein
MLFVSTLGSAGCRPLPRRAGRARAEAGARLRAPRRAHARRRAHGGPASVDPGALDDVQARAPVPRGRRGRGRRGGGRVSEHEEGRGEGGRVELRGRVVSVYIWAVTWFWRRC